jgi:hypothetical protein
VVDDLVAAFRVKGGARLGAPDASLDDQQKRTVAVLDLDEPGSAGLALAPPTGSSDLDGVDLRLPLPPSRRDCVAVVVIVPSA